MADFKLRDFTERGTALLERARTVFARYPDAVDKNIKLPSTMQPADGKIKLVFIGQYSSGKSSLIKMLTGNEKIEIGAAIVTDEPQSYDWGELEIVDTPGIHTGIRADHDRKSYEEIEHAALLIFVVTNEGFDDFIGQHFRKLAVEQKRGRNMVLVINKMDRTALGNVPEQQKIIADDLCRMVAPYSTEELYLSFVSTDMYFKSLTATDERRRKRYRERSGCDQFVENLNRFAASRGVLSKFQTPLETLKAIIKKNIDGAALVNNNAELNKIEKEYGRAKHTIEDGKFQLRYDLERLAEACANQIRAAGSSAASDIVPGISEAQYKSTVDNAPSRSEQYVRDCEQKMMARLTEVFDGIDHELEHSALSIELRRQFGISSNYSPSEEPDGISLGLETRSNLAMIGMKPKEASALALKGVPLLGDVKAVSVVKDVGHLFGVKFAPWGATNIVAGASKFLGVIGAAYSVYKIGKKVFGEDEEKKMRDQFLAAQEEVRDKFNAAAESARSKMIAAAMSEVERLIDLKLKEAAAPLETINKMNDRRRAFVDGLKSISNDLNALMDDVQKTARV